MRAIVVGGHVRGSIDIPSSKSYTQRLFLFSAFLGIPIRLRNIGFAEDELVAMDIANKCGASVSIHNHTVEVEPSFACPDKIDAMESGTSARLSMALLAAKGCRSVISADRRLLIRPFKELSDFLESNGVSVNISEDKIALDGKHRVIINRRISGETSSQFVSSALLFLAVAGGENEVLEVTGNIVSRSYIDITLDCLRTLGISCGWDENRIWLRKGIARKHMVDISVESDYSSAAFIYLVSLFRASGRVELKGLKRESLQPDSSIMALVNSQCASLADDSLIIDGPGKIELQGIVDVDQFPDLAPVLAVAGIFSKSGITLLGVSRLRQKESDRLVEIQRLVKAFGGTAEHRGNSLRIRPPSIVQNPHSLDFSDHRMIMAGIVAGIMAGYVVSHGSVEKISKSYPQFLEHLAHLGIPVELKPDN